MTEQLGIMRNVDFGMRDTNRVMLWFMVHTLEGVSLQSINRIEAVEFLEANNIQSINDLEGHACVVAVDDTRDTVQFLRLHKIK